MNPEGKIMFNIYKKSPIDARHTFLCFVLTGVFSLTLSNSVYADVTAVFDAGDGMGITIEYRDDNHVRMRSPDGSYFLITDGRAYMVSGSPGQWMVLSMDDFAAMARQAGIAGTEIEIPDDQGDYTLRDTGRTETIAGIQGQVHEVVVSDGWGEDRVSEIVLSSHEDALAAYRGMTAIVRVLGEMAGQQGLDSMMQTQYGLDNRAILRADNDWRLTSVERGSISDNSFTLPAEPTELPGLGGLFSAGGDDGGEAAAALQEWLGDEAGNVRRAAADEVRSATDEAAEEASRSVTDGVRDGVRDGIRSIFRSSP